MNQTIQDASRTMMKGEELSKFYWREAIHTAPYTLNRILYQRKYGKTSYELWYGKTPTVKYFKVFGSKCYIWRDEDNLGKFDNREDEGIFLGYSIKRKAYRCYNIRLNKIVESASVKDDESTTKDSKTISGYESYEPKEENKKEEIISK